MATLTINRSGYTLPTKTVKPTQPAVTNASLRELVNLLRLVKESGLVDAELAAGEWQPYRDPRKEA